MRRNLSYWRKELRWWFRELIDLLFGDRKFTCSLLLSLTSILLSLLSMYMSAMRLK